MSSMSTAPWPKRHVWGFGCLGGFGGVGISGVGSKSRGVEFTVRALDFFLFLVSGFPGSELAKSQCKMLGSSFEL